MAGYRKLAYNRELAASINSGLQKMNDAKTDIGLMKVRWGLLLLLLCYAGPCWCCAVLYCCQSCI
jgi:hypothetical protein